MQKLAIGIDLGGTNTSFGIVDNAGKILLQDHMPTTGHGDITNYISVLKDKLTPMMAKVGKEHIVGAGIGAPNGNFNTGEIVFAPNLPWKGVIPFAQLISEALQIRTILTNDAKAAAIGEMIYGAAKGMKDFILVTLGTGLGSGFVANGNIIYGHDGLAGELGHVIAVRDGRKCNCGLHGCLERYASATGIVITAELWLKEQQDETLLRAHKDNITAKMITDAAEKGDAFALKIFDFTGKILGQSLANAIAITSPKAIIFFGGLAQAGDYLFTPTKKYLEENLLPVYRNKVAILPSSLDGADAAILGASALAW